MDHSFPSASLEAPLQLLGLLLSPPHDCLLLLLLVALERSPPWVTLCSLSLSTAMATFLLSAPLPSFFNLHQATNSLQLSTLDFAEKPLSGGIQQV
jgi:hypothetical protein